MSVPKDMYFESIVRPEQNGKLLLDCVAERYTYHSKEEWKSKISEGFVYLNGFVSTIKSVVQTGDKILYHVANYSEPEVPLDYKVLFEDDEFLLVSKPAGIPVHHTGKIFYNTFTAHIRRELNLETATPMHRLDRDTGGIMLFAKDVSISSRFQKNLDKILLRKFYLTVVKGNFLNGETICEMPLSENVNSSIKIKMNFNTNGKPCKTIFKKLLYLSEKNYSVVECELITGRKHQIRAHLSELGFPIIGDKIYSCDGEFYKKMSSGISLTDSDYQKLGSHYQMLHAYKIELLLPYWSAARTFIDFSFHKDMENLLKVVDITTVNSQRQ